MSAAPSSVDDPDAAQAGERTVLAWRRTGLALVVGAVTLGRLSLDVLGPVVVVPTLVVAAASAWVAWASGRSRSPVGHAASVLRDGALPAVVACSVAGLALGELVAAAASTR